MVHSKLVSFFHQYGRSLVQGSKHLHKSLPRILSLWFDYASRTCELENVRNYLLSSECVLPNGLKVSGSNVVFYVHLNVRGVESFAILARTSHGSDSD